MTIHIILFSALIVFITISNPSTGLIAAFVSGLLIDIWTGEQIGFSSTIYLIVGLLLTMYTRKFNAKHLGFIVPFVLIMSISYSFLLTRAFVSSTTLLRHGFLAGGTATICWLLYAVWFFRFVEKRE